MSIYEEMSRYGYILIIDTQILIHAHSFSPPPVFTLYGIVLWRDAEEVNNWEESGSGTGEQRFGLRPIRIAMPVGAWLSNLSPKKAATEAKGRACAVASSVGDGRGTAYLELVNKNNRHFDSAVGTPTLRRVWDSQRLCCKEREGSSKGLNSICSRPLGNFAL